MQDDDDRPQFVGFYWTYPVKWAGFTKLSPDADEAARQSRTIRYQRELAQRYVREKRGVLVDEVVFLESEKYYGTPDVIDPLTRRAEKHCGPNGGKATLLWVNFAQSNGWRPHSHLQQCLYKLDLRNEALDPINWMIDGEVFNPTKHFREWHGIDRASPAWRQENIDLALAAALDRIPEGYGRNPEVAKYLNDLGVRTKTGRPWTADNVKQAIKKLTISPEDAER